MTSIVLTRPHTHAGKPHTAGERLDVERGTADWLVANGIARHDHQPVPAPAPAPEGDGAAVELNRTTTQRKESKS